MKIATILGSARDDGYNARAIAVFHDELRKLDDMEIIDIRPAQMALRIPNTGRSEDAMKLRELVRSADGVLVTSPEYHGSFSSLIKMTIENMGYPSALSEKPVVLMGVAGGELGTVKTLEHLGSVLRHVGALTLPKFVSVARGSSLFSEDGQISDPRIEARIRALANELVTYVDKHVCQPLTLEQMVRENSPDDTD